MGIQGGSSLFWKTHKINFDLALGVVQALKSKKEAAADAQQVTGGNGMTRSNVSATSCLTIPLDGNLVAYKFVGSNSSYSPPDGVFQVAEGLSQKLVNVPVFVDGDRRHHQKELIANVLQNKV